MKKEISVDLAIIGAGSAGISAFKEASKITDNIVMIDHGPLGTTCARVGCMPSKALIQIADYYHDRLHYAKLGIEGGDALRINIPAAMRHVRALRDDFTAHTIKYIESLGERFILGNAELVEPQLIKVNEQKIIAKSIILATGTSPIIPEAWQSFKNQILTSDNIFEQKDFEKKIAVIGGGPIGLELGQALSRFGIEVNLFHSQEFIGNLSDPEINAYAIKCFSEEFSLHLNENAQVEKTSQSLTVKSGGKKLTVDQIVAATGRKSNFASLNLDKFGIKLNKAGVPSFDPSTMQIENLPLYIAGDAGKFRPVLHEAADDGSISGYNAVHGEQNCFQRRTPLTIIFTQPNIAVIGKSYRELHGTHFITGKVSFETQGRARLMAQNKGLMHIYANAQNGELLGAEMIAPEGEHLAHLLAHAMQNKMSVFDFLQLPFYHPVVEEGLRTALRDIVKQINLKKCNPTELAMCDSSAVSCLS